MVGYFIMLWDFASRKHIEIEQERSLNGTLWNPAGRGHLLGHTVTCGDSLQSFHWGFRTFYNIVVVTVFQVFIIP